MKLFSAIQRRTRVENFSHIQLRPYEVRVCRMVLVIYDTPFPILGEIK